MSYKSNPDLKMWCGGTGEKYLQSIAAPVGGWRAVLLRQIEVCLDGCVCVCVQISMCTGVCCIRMRHVCHTSLAAFAAAVTVNVCACV